MKLDSIISSLIAEAASNGLSREQCTYIAEVKKSKPRYLKKPINHRFIVLISSLFILLFALKNPDLYKTPVEFIKQLQDDYSISSKDACIVGQTALSMELTRPISNCKICENVNKVPIVHNMTQDHFLKYHAYTGAPVLVKGGAANWSALKVFGFKYFKLLYEKLDALSENDELGCQFFPYKTNFATLEQVFKMSKKRAALKKDQWYVGWSNCVPRIMKALRRHYSRPEFLPSDSESSHLDWMFMGGSGTGAQMHIDAVNRPSWQAMIKGRKTWILEPPPECENICTKHLSITMEPGDILVVDTNKWYHTTFIHAGNMSLTIGSEYD